MRNEKKKQSTGRGGRASECLLKRMVLETGARLMEVTFTEVDIVTARWPTGHG